MLGRRGFLGALLSAPVTAGAAVNQAANMVAGSMPASGVFSEAAEVCSVEARPPNQLDKLFYKARSEIEIRNRVRNTRVEDMPLHIQAMKSWSPAMKQHALGKHLRRAENDDLWNHEWTDDFKRKIIKMAGL